MKQKNQKPAPEVTDEEFAAYVEILTTSKLLHLIEFPDRERVKGVVFSSGMMWRAKEIMENNAYIRQITGDPYPHYRGKPNRASGGGDGSFGHIIITCCYGEPATDGHEER